MDQGRTKPDFCYDSGCPLAEVGKGFVLGSGDPEKAQIAFILEAPGSEEVAFDLKPNAERRFLRTQSDVDQEIVRRQKAYPDIPLAMLKRGAPVVGKMYAQLEQWALPAAGLERNKLFVDNTLRCLPPKGKQGAYPTGVNRHLAEKCCRHYDRFNTFRPDVLVVTLHPAGIMREVTPLPLQIKDFEKARDFASEGLRIAVLLGGKAAKAFMRYADTVTRWRGHYERVKKDWPETYKALFEVKEKVKRKAAPKKTKKKKDEVLDVFDEMNLPLKKKRGKRT